MTDKRNAYHVLGLKKGATEQEIKEAYKVLARRHHPDKNQGDPTAMSRFIEIKEAYESLIEKKTSTNELLVKMEEKGHEIRRSGIITRVAIFLMLAFAMAAVGVASWEIYFKDLDFHQGRKAALAGDAATAKERLTRVVKKGGPRAIEARDAIVWSELRTAHAKQPAEALAAEHAVLDLLAGARDSRGLALKGDLHFRFGDVAAAQKSWREARAAKDATAETWARAYAGHLRARNAKEAAAVLEEIRARFADSPWARWATTVALLRQGKVDEAPESDRGDPAAVRIASAAAHVAGARMITGEERDDRLEAAESLVKDLLDEIARSHRQPQDVELYFGFPFLETPVRHEDPYDWVPSLGVEDPEQALSLLVVALVEKRNPQGALKLAQQAYEIDRRMTPAGLTLADFLLRGGDIGSVDRARELFELTEQTAGWKPAKARAVAGVARSWAAYARSSSSKLLEKERAAEIAAWKRARLLDPSDPEYDLGLALAYASQKSHAERAKVDRETIKRHPGYGFARLDLGLALLAMGKEKEALAELENASKLADSKALALLNMGHVHYDRRRSALALAAYKRAAEAGDPESRATAWFRIACLHSLAKDRAAAQQAWDRAQAEHGAVDANAATVLSPVRIDITDPALDWVRPHLAKAGSFR